MASGTTSLLKLAVSWCAASALGVLIMANRDGIQAFLAANGLVYEMHEGETRAASATPRREAPASQAGGVEIRANASGHFETRARVNGWAIDVMVDTGATVVALTWDDARAVGIHVRDSDFKHQVSTANGVARVAQVTLDQVSIEDITVRNVRAVVAEPGKLGVTLLGMSFLSKLAKAEMSRGVLILRE